MSKQRGKRKIRRGKVVSNKPNKTIILAIERFKKHPLYKRYFRDVSKIVAHDEENLAKIGDLVEVMETRPLSKTKRWRLTKVLEKAK